MSNDDNTMDYYNRSRQTFVNASGKFQTVLGNMGVKSNEVNVYPGVPLAHLLNPSYVAQPSLASRSGAVFLSSTEQLRVGTSEAMSLIDTLRQDKKDQTFTLQLNNIKEEFKAAHDDALQSQQLEMPKVVDQEKAPDDLQTYYRSIIDVQFSSRNLFTLATEISKEPIPESSNQSIVSKLVDKFKALWNRIRMKIQQVADRLQGLAKTFGNSISDLLDKLEDVLRKGAEAVITAFISLSDYFVEFMVTLTEQLFKFLTRFSSIAAAEGYNISSIEIKAPTLKFEYVSMFQVSIPLPNIDPPEMTLSISRAAEKANQI